MIALGGGSVLDTAKCIAVLASNPGTIAGYALNPETPIKGAAPVVAIPTTAGTGSEADIYAGIHPDSDSAGVGIASHHIIPRVAILDPDMTRTLPPHITAALAWMRCLTVLKGISPKRTFRLQNLSQLMDYDGVCTALALLSQTQEILERVRKCC